MLDASQNCAIRIPNARATTAATVPIVDFVQCVVYVLAGTSVYSTSSSIVQKIFTKMANSELGIYKQ